MLFEKVEVTKITSTSARNHIKVYIYSTHLIPKKTVCYVENQIEEQLFSQGNIPVTIIEEYRLSEQYTPENLMHAYKESILFELEQKSVLEKNMFQKAKCRFEGERTMCLTMADTIVAEGKTSEITSYLKDVFENRFHVPVDVEIDYEEVGESKYKKFNEMQLQQEVDAIRERNQKLQAQHATEEAAKAKETEGVSKKKAEKAAKAAKAAAEKARTAAEKEQRDKVSTEQAAVKSLEALREEDLQNQQKTYNDALAALNLAQSSGKLTKQQHEMMLLELNKQNADARLKIEQSYYSDAQSMALTDANTKEDIVRKSNQRVINAEKEANTTRAALQTQLNELIKSFKDQFKLTTVDEDYAMQLKVLEASYQARKEMAEKNNLDTTELDKTYYRAKEQLESEHQQRLLAIRNQYGLTTQQERHNSELEQLKLARDQELLTEEEYEQAVQNLKRDSYKKQFDYYADLFSGAIQALQQAEMDQIDAKYDAEIEAAKGDADEVERLENEKAQKKLDIQKKYADVNFAIKASQIIADTAVSIMKAYADLGPIAGSIAAALMGVTGIAQLASAKAERDKVKNMTLSGSTSSGSAAGARVATGRQEGGKIDVRRAQDGKLFPDSDYDPDARGFIDRPTVIVGEGPAGQSKEWVASNAAVENPTVAPILDILDKSQQAGNIRTLDLNQAIRARMAGYASGGSISSTSSTPDPVPTGNSGAALPLELMEKLARSIIHLDEYGVPASVVLSDIERKTDLRNRARAIGSKKQAS